MSSEILDSHSFLEFYQILEKKIRSYKLRHVNYVNTFSFVQQQQQQACSYQELNTVN